MKACVKNIFLIPALIIGLGSILAGHLGAQSLPIVHSFTADDVNGFNSDGKNPFAGLIASGNTLFGTTVRGGGSGLGTVFAVNTNGSGFMNLHSFTFGGDGALPVAGLTLSGNTLYGTTEYGGSAGNGTVFKVNINGTGYTILYSFTANDYPGRVITNLDGANPRGGLVLSGNTLYGTATYGGSSGRGTVFAVNIDGTGFSTLHHFAGSDGANPAAGLVVNSNLLYGTTSSLDARSYYIPGTVFRINMNGTGFTNLHSFAGYEGVYLEAGLILSGNTLYGTASRGGYSTDYGTVFAVNVDGTGFTGLYSFTGGSDGGVPYGGLILSSNTLYGTTYSGGGANKGTVFAIRTNGTGFKTLYEFVGGSDGANPSGSLVLLGTTLYGTTYYGGDAAYYGNGTVFSLPLGPELVAISVSWNTNDGGLDFVYANPGGPLPGPTTAKLFWASGTNIANAFIAMPIFATNLPAGFSGQVTNHLPAASLQSPPAGATHLLLVLDLDNFIAEYTKANNTFALKLVPDLVATALSRNPTIGGLDFTYANQGAPLPTNTTVKLFWASGTNLANAFTGLPIYSAGIAAGFSGPAAGHVPDSALQSPPSGTTYLLLALDPDNFIAEDNRTNNTLALVFPPDLVATSLSWSPADGGLDFTYANTGGQLPVATSAYILWATGTNGYNAISYYYIPVYSAEIPANFAGQVSGHVDPSYVQSPPPGATYLLLILDYHGLITESNRLNNIFALQLVPDLVATSLSWNSTTNGGLDFAYRNQGLPLPADTTARIFWANGTNFANAFTNAPIYTTNIPAGFIGQVTNHVPEKWLPPPPTNATYLLLVLDPGNLITEATKTNNTLALRNTFRHVVLLMMENRSFDHFLGWLPGAEGRQAGLIYTNNNGQPFPTWHLAPNYQGCGCDLPDQPFGAFIQYNNGLCDGWLRANTNDNYTIGYYDQYDLPFFGQVAPNWTVCDRYFAAIMAETQPNRIYQHAAQTDSLTNRVRSDNFTHNVNLPTIWDRLSQSNINARYYYAGGGGGGGVTTVAYSFLSLWGASKYFSISYGTKQFFQDCSDGTLPAVSFVDPDFTSVQDSFFKGDTGGNDDHPHSHIRNGEVFLASIYNAIAASPNWSSTVLIINFDEWGGFYDHVPPPKVVITGQEVALGNDGRLGFRVPCLVISPWSQGHTVAHEQFDHTSVLKLIENRWNLSPLTIRDELANDLADVLDFDHPNFAAPPPVLNLVGKHFGGDCQELQIATHDDGSVVISWDATCRKLLIQTRTSFIDPWINLTNTVSPYVLTSAQRQLYQLRLFRFEVVH